MNGSKNTELYQVSHTVTQEDHDSGSYTLVPVGDVVVFNMERVTTVEERVVSVERDGVEYTEPEKEAPKKKSKKTDEDAE